MNETIKLNPISVECDIHAVSFCWADVEIKPKNGAEPYHRLIRKKFDKPKLFVDIKISCSNEFIWNGLYTDGVINYVATSNNELRIAKTGYYDSFQFPKVVKLIYHPEMIKTTTKPCESITMTQ